MTIKFSDITGGGIPYGNTAGRPTPTVGRLYSNGEAARLELEQLLYLEQILFLGVMQPQLVQMEFNMMQLRLHLIQLFK
jgi:hypothetical protein